MGGGAGAGAGAGEPGFCSYSQLPDGAPPVQVCIGTHCNRCTVVRVFECV